jgi:hypothetical protein
VAIEVPDIHEYAGEVGVVKPSFTVFNTLVPGAAMSTTGP